MKCVSGPLTKSNAYRTRQIDVCQFGKQESVYCTEEARHYSAAAPCGYIGY